MKKMNLEKLRLQSFVTGGRFNLATIVGGNDDPYCSVARCPTTNAMDDELSELLLRKRPG